jgi:hypothetical protein
MILQKNDNEKEIQSTNEANLKLNAELNENHIDDSEPTPTYLYNNTPAIKINENVKKRP